MANYAPSTSTRTTVEVDAPPVPPAPSPLQNLIAALVAFFSKLFGRKN